MTKAKIVLCGIAAGILGVSVGMTEAADSARCLSQTERRAAISEKRAVPLGRAVRAARGRTSAEVLRARLCQDAPGLIYRLTLLGRDGKVTRATVDATTGQLLGASR